MAMFNHFIWFDAVVSCQFMESEQKSKKKFNPNEINDQKWKIEVALTANLFRDNTKVDRNTEQAENIEKSKETEKKERKRERAK